MTTTSTEGVPLIYRKDLGKTLVESTWNIPNTNADGLPAIAPSEEQKYLFDNQGWIIIPGVLDADDTAEMREFCYRLKQEPNSIPAIDRSPIGGPLQKLCDHPLILGFMNEFVSHPPYASPECYGFRMESTHLDIRDKGAGGFGPHNGSGMMRLPGDTHLYNCYPGKAHSGLTCIVWELNPVEVGDGGTLFVSGSHKSTFSAPASLQQPDSPLWQTYACPAGSLLIFSEATTHSGTPWTNQSRERVPIFSRYNSICSKWHRWEPHPELLASMPPKRQTLFRPVYCEGNVI
jgi:hypothetical protein